MSCRYVLLLSASLALLAGSAQAENQVGSALLAQVSELGRLNGVALACGQPALTARLREIMVNSVPKTRELGEVYEQASNAAFLAQGLHGAKCPGGKVLAEQVDVARQQLSGAAAQ